VTNESPPPDFITQYPGQAPPHVQSTLAKLSMCRTAFAFTRDGIPLGTFDAVVWTRDEPPPQTTREERDAQRKQTPIDEKESLRWITLLESAGYEAEQAADTRFLAVADSEADIFELFAAAQLPENTDWLVRSAQNQAVGEWLLLTSLPVATLADVERVVDSYCVRLMIEVFFRTLKSGCRVASRRFETLDRMLNCVAVSLIVAKTKEQLLV